MSVLWFHTQPDTSISRSIANTCGVNQIIFTNHALYKAIGGSWWSILITVIVVVQKLVPA